MHKTQTAAIDEVQPAERFDTRSFRSAALLNGLAFVTGLVSGYAAIGFRFLIGFCQNVLFHNRVDFHLVSPLEHSRGPWVVLIPVGGLLVVDLIIRAFAREARGHGVPEVIEAVMTQGGRIRKRVAIVKALASALTIGAGGSVGREGPIVQIGSATGSALGQMFRVPRRVLKILVGCGAAGGIAATFNTPVAGVVFAIELIVLEFRARSFIPLVVSSVFATVVSRSYFGNTPVYLVPEHQFVHPTELVFYLGLGVVAGLVGCLTVWALYRIEHICEVAPVPFFVTPMAGGLVLGVLGYFQPAIFGVGHETVTSTLLEHVGLSAMVTLIAVKILAMSVTLSAGGSGGVFAPTLFIGAMVGGAYGWVVHYYFPTLSASYGAYALVGMAAVFASATRATLTAILILFEMTLDQSIILPLMFVCVVADQVSVAVLKDRTIYSLKLQHRGLRYVNDFGMNLMAVTPMREIMTTDVEVLHVEMTLEQAQQVVGQTAHQVYPVINSKSIFMGVMPASELASSIKTRGLAAKVGDVMQTTTSVAHPDEMVQASLRHLDPKRDPRIIVVDRWDSRLLGIVGAADFMRLSSREAE